MALKTPATFGDRNVVIHPAVSSYLMWNRWSRCSPEERHLLKLKIKRRNVTILNAFMFYANF